MQPHDELPAELLLLILKQARSIITTRFIREVCRSWAARLPPPEPNFRLNYHWQYSIGHLRRLQEWIRPEDLWPKFAAVNNIWMIHTAHEAGMDVASRHVSIMIRPNDDTRLKKIFQIPAIAYFSAAHLPLCEKLICRMHLEDYPRDRKHRLFPDEPGSDSRAETFRKTYTPQFARWLLGEQRLDSDPNAEAIRRQIWFWMSQANSVKSPQSREFFDILREYLHVMPYEYEYFEELGIERLDAIGKWRPDLLRLYSMRTIDQRWCLELQFRAKYQSKWSRQIMIAALFHSNSACILRDIIHSGLPIEWPRSKSSILRSFAQLSCRGEHQKKQHLMLSLDDVADLMTLARNAIVFPNWPKLMKQWNSSANNNCRRDLRAFVTIAGKICDPSFDSEVIETLICACTCWSCHNAVVKRVFAAQNTPGHVTPQNTPGHVTPQNTPGHVTLQDASKNIFVVPIAEMTFWQWQSGIQVLAING